MQINFDDILTEWSYRLPKGFPTIVDGKFTERDEVIILNEILNEKGLNGLELPEGNAIFEVTTANLSSDPTDVKEALVCLFADAGLSDSTIIDTYRQGLDKNLDPATRTKIAKDLKTKLGAVASSYGKNYGIPGYAKMAEYVAQAVADPKAHKADIVFINNGVGAADAIVHYDGFPKLKPGMVRRDAFFEGVRSHAVELINSNYNIKGYYPDNWCPGDIYFVLNSKAAGALKTQQLNVGAKSLNNYFYGSNNTAGPILAVSLKMQQAQAGKGTTFIKNVVVDGVTPQDKLGKDAGNQQVIKFRDVRRRFDKYYTQTDAWMTDPKVLDKVRGTVNQLGKMAGITDIPVKPNQTKELVTYLTKNKNKLKKAVELVSEKLGKTVDTATTFQQAYTRFVNNLKAMNIDKVEGNSRDFIKKIEDKNKQSSGGKLNSAKMQELLSQKAATYDLASTLIEKWTEKTKKISPAFADYFKQVKNPFVAITLFAIAQQGNWYQ